MTNSTSLSDDLFTRIAGMQARQLQKTRALIPDIKSVNDQFMLPFWPDQTRGVPVIALRSALFGAIRKGARAYLERIEIHALDGITIRYTGARLDQGDLDVWETVLHIARAQALGNICRVTGYQLLMVLGKTDTGKNRDILNRRLSRIKATALDVTVNNQSYEGSLIDEVYREGGNREFVMRLNPKLRTLFEPGCYSQIDWRVRQALDGKPLAQWLHGFYSSHAQPHPLKIETLQNLCGSDGELRRFRQTVKEALNALSEASNVFGQPFNYRIRDDLVLVEKQSKRRAGRT